MLDVTHEEFHEGTLTILHAGPGLTDPCIGVGPSIDDPDRVRFAIAEGPDALGFDMTVEEIDQLVDELVDARDAVRPYTWADIEDDMNEIREAFTQLRDEQPSKTHKFVFAGEPEDDGTNIIVPIGVSDLEAMLAETHEDDVLELHIPIG